MKSLLQPSTALELKAVCLTSPATPQQQHLGALLQLAGLSLFLATIEMLIPKPMPFLKLGIANLPILLFVSQLCYPDLLLLVFLKVFCQSIVSGTMLSYIFVFSACGSLVSSTAMWLLARLPATHFSLLGISIVGAASSNGMQLFLALIYFFPATGSLLIPWSLTFGLGTGVLLGLFALQFCRKSSWYKRFHVFLEQTYRAKINYARATVQPARAGHSPYLKLKENLFAYFQKNRKRNWKDFAWQRSSQRFSFGMLSLFLMFAINKYEPLYLGVELLLFLALNWQLGYRPWYSSMLLLFAMLVFFHLLLPSGYLLWEWNWAPYIHWRFTQGALERGIGKAFFLLNLIQISRFSVNRELRLPTRFGHIIQLVFTYYESFLNCPIVFHGRKPLMSLDNILCYTDNQFRCDTADSGNAASEREELREGQEGSSENRPQSRLALRAQGRMGPCYWSVFLLLQIAVLAAAFYMPFYLLQEQWLG